MNIDINNIDDLILMDGKLKKLLPEFQSIFDQWLIGKRVPALHFLMQKSRLLLLEKLSDPNQIEILTKYFNDSVTVQPINYHVTQHVKSTVSDLECHLNEIYSQIKNYSISRNASNVYLSFWK